MGKVLPLIRSRKLPPSSQLLNNWDVVRWIVGAKVAWSELSYPKPSFPISQGVQVHSAQLMKDRCAIIDATHTEIGLYSVLECILADGVFGARPFPSQLIIVPQLGLPPPSGSSVDLSVTIELEITVSISLMCMCIYIILLLSTFHQNYPFVCPEIKEGRDWQRW